MLLKLLIDEETEQRFQLTSSELNNNLWLAVRWDYVNLFSRIQTFLGEKTQGSVLSERIMTIPYRITRKKKCLVEVHIDFSVWVFFL